MMKLPPDAVAQADQIEARTLELLDAAVIAVQRSPSEFEGSVGMMRLAIITKEFVEQNGGDRPVDMAAFDMLAEATRRLATAGKPPKTITTADELAATPRYTVALSAVGTIAQRYTDEWCAIFGDYRPYIWSDLALPAQVLWEPPPGGVK